MTLGELIDRLRKEDPNKIILAGFHDPHSYRGSYYDLAFEPTERIHVSDMLQAAESAIGETYEGYKGGSYHMSSNTDVYLAYYGSTGDELSNRLLNYMLKDTYTPR
jgi:DNA repair photolyase